MNHKDRSLATILYEPVDRPTAWLRMQVPLAEPGLKKYFGVNSMDGLKRILDYDPNHIACALDFAKTAHFDRPDDRILSHEAILPDIPPRNGEVLFNPLKQVS